MRLFHVSETPNITVFKTRKPKRSDLVNETGLVWALSERTLVNFFTPRDCPRVTYHVAPHTHCADKKNHLSALDIEHVMVIEHAWVQRMQAVTLYVYEFDPKPFVLQDEQAGYYVSRETVQPLACYVIQNVWHALASFNVEVRLVENLWPICRTIQASTFYWSMCRMANAQPACKNPNT